MNKSVWKLILWSTRLVWKKPYLALKNQQWFYGVEYIIYKQKSYHSRKFSYFFQIIFDINWDWIYILYVYIYDTYIYDDIYIYDTIQEFESNSVISLVETNHRHHHDIDRKYGSSGQISNEMKIYQMAIKEKWVGVL